MKSIYIFSAALLETCWNYAKGDFSIIGKFILNHDFMIHF